MQALFLVLHKIEKLDDLLIALQNNGITGGTIIDSKGMINTLRNNDNFIIESLRSFLYIASIDGKKEKMVKIEEYKQVLSNPDEYMLMLQW